MTLTLTFILARRHEVMETWKHGNMGDKNDYLFINVMQNSELFHSNLDKYVNKCVRSFDVDLVTDIIQRMAETYPGKLIVSIGSGNAALEAYAQNETTRFICIDPNPLSYSPGPLHIEPDYDNVENLIKSRPDLVENCLLLLNWCDPNESSYDYDAIQALKPLAILSLYEVCYGGNGAAGSKLFYDWTQNCSDYILVESYCFAKQRERGLMDMRINWHQTTQIPCKEDAVVNYVDPASISSCQEGCLIM